MSEDLVTRLHDPRIVDPLAREAADEIERLRKVEFALTRADAEIELLRDKLRACELYADQLAAEIDRQATTEPAIPSEPEAKS
jgi:hypothetical protein